MSLFDSNKPCAKVIRSPMGGGWIIPITVEGEDVLERYFNEPAYPIDPLGGVEGYIVEPNKAEELAEYLFESNHAWVVE